MKKFQETLLIFHHHFLYLENQILEMLKILNYNPVIQIFYNLCIHHILTTARRTKTEWFLLSVREMKKYIRAFVKDNKHMIKSHIFEWDKPQFIKEPKRLKDCKY